MASHSIRRQTRTSATDRQDTRTGSGQDARPATSSRTRTATPPRDAHPPDTVVRGGSSSSHTRHDVQQTGAQPWAKGIAATVGPGGHALPDAALELPLASQTTTPAAPGTGLRGLAPSAQHLGETLVRGGTEVEQGGRQLQLAGHPLGSTLTALGRQTRHAGETLGQAPHTAATVHQQALQLQQDTAALLQRVGNGTQQAITEGLETAKRGLQVVGNGVESFTREAAEAVNVNHNIDQLGEGDKYTLALGAALSVEGGRVYERGKVQVDRLLDGQYRVRVDGEAGAGLYGEIGGTVGFAGASVRGDASLGAGGRVEMTFATAEEAKRATDIILRQAAVSGASALHSTAGMATQLAAGPSREDYGFLALHMSAVELRGVAAAKAMSGLGLTSGTSNLAGLFAGGSIRSEDTVRLEFQPGQPMEVVVRNRERVDVTASLGLKFTDSGAQVKAGPGIYAGGRATLLLQHETRFTLPADVEPAQLLADPTGTLAVTSRELLRTRQERTTCVLDTSTSNMGSGSGVRRQLTTQGSPEDLVRSGVVTSLVQGDLQGTRDVLRDRLQGQYSSVAYDTHGVALSPTVSLMGFGVQLDGKALLTDVHLEQGTAADARDLNWLDDDPDFEHES